MSFLYRARITPWTLVALALSACREPLGEPAVAVGSYAMERIDGLALPTTVPCGVYRALSGTVVLRRDRSVTHTLRYGEIGTTKEITYFAKGTFRESGGGVELTLFGGWSHQSERGTRRFALRQSGDQLHEDGLGRECDGSSTALYRLAP